MASTLCAVHCAVVPLLPTALGAAGLGFLAGSRFEWALTLAAVLFASLALVVGWRARRWGVWRGGSAGLLVLGILGVLAVRVAEDVHPIGPVGGVVAGLMLAVGHVLNLRPGAGARRPQASA